MLTLIIVDDEEIEREGMLYYIPWKKYDIEVIGMAWNGLEAYELIKEKKPDIVLTDISMPIMNGLELIEKVTNDNINVEFIVLSGYGEYEFTSKAMEYGVRHYILKPCDESKFAIVLEKVKEGILDKKAKHETVGNYQNMVKRLLPHAKSQIFRNMLLGKEQIENEFDLFISEIGTDLPNVYLIGFRMENGFNYIEQFVLDNIIVELLGKEYILLVTNIKNDMLFLVDSSKKEMIDLVIKETRTVFSKFKTNPSDNIYVSISEQGNWNDIDNLYIQVEKMLYLSEVDKNEDIKWYDNVSADEQEALILFDYMKIKKLVEYEDIIYEVCLLFMKMKVRGYSDMYIIEFCEWILKHFYEYEDTIQKNISMEELNEMFANYIYMNQGSNAIAEERVNNILFHIYINIGNQNLSIQYLCKEILYMNEDYFGRFFKKKFNMKFSDYVLEKRMMLAKEIISFSPNHRISNVSEMLGFSPDGQYFSRIFKKYTNYSPSEYRESHK